MVLLSLVVALFVGGVRVVVYLWAVVYVRMSSTNLVDYRLEHLRLGVTDSLVR